MTSASSINNSTAEYINLSSTDVYFLVDISGSMNTDVIPGVSRWDYMKEWLRSAVDAAIKVDTDGVGIGFFNHALTKNDSVRSIADFDTFVSSVTPGGNTMMGSAVKTIVDEWFSRMQADPNTKPVRLICFTDGEATDGANLKSNIVGFVNNMQQMGLGDHHLAISFVQVGNDSQATAFLQSLDDLKNTMPSLALDIIDTKGSEWVMNHTFEQLVQAAELD